MVCFSFNFIPACLSKLAGKKKKRAEETSIDREGKDLRLIVGPLEDIVNRAKRTHTRREFLLLSLFHFQSLFISFGIYTASVLDSLRVGLEGSSY